ncbi:WD repeat-containing protein 89 [Trichogramma pretiosum]|uniref:WD repeat-containing protein 89 n=1 Tax=Trichogramma pretiosum TaxID=7493 RepID=UPI0006C96C5A|nr:WD repeat-containing protein 89 [Trichogramma pretiosum]
MSKIEESLKRLSVDNNKAKCLARSKGEYAVAFKETVNSDDEQNYILGLCGTQSERDFRIAVALADHSCVVYSVNDGLSQTAVLKHNKSPIIGIKFSPTSKNIIYTACENGTVTACDLRAKGKVVAEFKDNSEDGKLKPLASFDLSCEERLMAGGTEHIGGDAFILFWDVRYSNSKLNGRDNLLGGYWESHMDDVTSLAFHPTKRDALASGSTDGLINVFDLKQSSEDQALMYSLNTESSVDRIGWFANDNLWCTTHTHSLQLWKYDDAVPYLKFDRSDLALSRNDDPDSCYLVRIHSPNSFGSPFLLAGSSSTKEETLKCLSFGKNQLELQYSMPGNEQVVRDSWLHEKSGCLVTGGESGVINVWKQSEPIKSETNVNSKRPIKIGAEKSRNDKNHRTKPY